jgi:hypothetical protein
MKIEKLKSLRLYFVRSRFVIKDLKEEQWYSRTYKNHKYPNFSSSPGYAKKYKCYLTAQMRAWILGDCNVETYCLKRTKDENKS